MMMICPSSIILAFSIILFIIPDLIDSYYVAIDAHAEECFHERVVSGTKMGLMFEVVEGGFLDIDVKITGKRDDLFLHHCNECGMF